MEGKQIFHPMEKNMFVIIPWTDYFYLTLIVKADN